MNRSRSFLVPVTFLGSVLGLLSACGDLSEDAEWERFADFQEDGTSFGPDLDGTDVGGREADVAAEDLADGPGKAPDELAGVTKSSVGRPIDFSRGKVVARGRHFEIAGERLELAGNHTWDTVVRFQGKSTPLTQLVGNFTRLWPVEVRRLTTNGAADWNTNRTFAISPMPYRRVNGKYDLDQLNAAYFDRLEAKVRAARDLGMVVSVVLFDGAYHRFFGADEWDHHPLNPRNNRQGVGPGDANGVHAPGDHVPYQRKYVKEVIRRVGSYPNVLFEIGNELHRSSVGWQKQMVRLVKKRSDRPVGVSYVTGLRDNHWMKTSGADWFAPHFSSPTRPAGLVGPIVYDTDHTWALRCRPADLATAAERGMYPLLMDGMTSRILRNLDNMAPCRAQVLALLRD